ncbi:MAG: amino acid aminotransferase [Burkholderiaceae bacterium]
MKSSPFAQVELAPRDPILGITELFKKDPRTTKANLGSGVYSDEDGNVPLLKAVLQAERALVNEANPRNYLPMEGFDAYNRQVQYLLFGETSPLLAAGRVATFETLGGTGALKVGADFLRRLDKSSCVYISDPSWANHQAIFEFANFEVKTYPYYDASKQDVDFDGMLSGLRAMPAGSVVVLHVCCHNPTGIDLTPAQWADVVAVCAEKGLVPFLDMAYQGFAKGIDEDAVALRLFVESGQSCLVASSFSKSFSLYGERIGALSIITANADETERVVSQVKRFIRTNYSNPPIHGASLVATILASKELRQLWEEELATMRNRIKAMREGLVSRLAKKNPGRDFSFIATQQGMFSFSGLNANQVERMATEFGIYAVSSGRICVAAINKHNIDTVAQAMATVIQEDVAA